MMEAAAHRVLPAVPMHRRRRGRFSMSRFSAPSIGRVLLALAVGAVGLALVATPHTSQADDLADTLALSTTAVTLDAGDYAWTLQPRQTQPDDGPALAVPTGFV